MCPCFSGWASRRTGLVPARGRLRGWRRRGEELDDRGGKAPSPVWENCLLAPLVACSTKKARPTLAAPEDPLQASRPTRVRWLIFLVAGAASWLLYLHRYSWGVIK